MPGYLVNHRYRSSTIAELVAGSTVELDTELAVWVNHDSPGCLTALEEAPTYVTPAIGEAVAASLASDAVELEPEPAVEKPKGGRRGSA